jgi:hypothetical protein
MKRLTVMVLALAVLAGSAMATSFLGRSSTVNKQYQFFGWANFGYNQTTLSYSWASGKYEALAATGQTKTTSCDVVAPLAMKQKGDAKSAGLGDLMVYARYGILQDPEKPLKVALLLGGNLPTASKNASPALSDRTTDVAFGLSLNTKKLGKFLGHVRAAYWFNGKIPDTETKVGDMFEYLLCGDYSVTKTLTPELALSGYLRDESQLGGTWIPKTEVSQHLVSALLMWKPISALTIRPKVSFPLTFISQGSTMASVYGGLDVWVTYP